MPRPSPRVIIPVRKPFMDDRGEILNVLDRSVTSVAIIRSVKGAVRANHYHKTDFHYCWLQSGGLIYYHRPVGSRKPPERWVIKPGQLFYTPPKHEHMMKFTKPSVLLVLSKNSRTMAHYEADTVRVAPLVEGR